MSGAGGSVVRHNQQMSADQRNEINTIRTYLRQAEQSNNEFLVQAMRLALELYGGDNYAPGRTSERARLDELYDFRLLQIAERLGVEHTTRSGAVAPAVVMPQVPNASVVTVLADSDNRARSEVIPTATLIDDDSELRSDLQR